MVYPFLENLQFDEEERHKFVMFTQCEIYLRSNSYAKKEKLSCKLRVDMGKDWKSSLEKKFDLDSKS